MADENQDVVIPRDADGNIDIAKIDPASIHANGESPWPNVSPEFDQKMLKHLLEEEDKPHFTVPAGADGNADSISATEVHFVPYLSLNDKFGNTVRYNQTYVITEAGVDGWHGLGARKNERQVSFIPGGGRKIKLEKSFTKKDYKFHIRNQEKGGSWLLGTLAASNDVAWGENFLSSSWGFEVAPRDKDGHECYWVWSFLSKAEDAGGIWWPLSSIGQAGRDKDWEWRTYERGMQGPPHGYYKIKFSPA